MSVFLNNGNGTFNGGTNYSGGGGVISVTAADLNGDGRPDLAVPNACFTGLAILLNAGDGTFGYFTKYYHQQILVRRPSRPAISIATARWTSS